MLLLTTRGGARYRKLTEERSPRCASATDRIESASFADCARSVPVEDRGVGRRPWCRSKTLAAPGRLLKSATEWTKCVFGSSAEAVEAENLFFSLGGPTPPMST